MRLFAVLLLPVVLVTGKVHPTVKIFILAGEGNVEGYASVGHLKKLAADDPDTYSHLLRSTTDASDGVATTTTEFVVRDDVYVAFDHHRTEEWTHGKLTATGFGSKDGRFGPELQLGHILGNMYEEPVVLVKAGWAGRSLAVDFASPSTNRTVGFQWHRMVGSIRKTANSLEEVLGPDYKYAKVEIGGFVWWQGYSDFPDPKIADAYGANLELFINDIRAELKRPYMPVVVAELGGQGIVNPDEAELRFRKMQEDVITDKFYPVSTRLVSTASYSEADDIEDYTLYYGRADTMLEISQALAMSLVEMDYKKNKGIGIDWSQQADVLAGEMQTFQERRNFKLLLIVGVGILVFLAIMKFGGNMGRTWNTAMERLQLKGVKMEDVDNAIDEVELEGRRTQRAPSKRMGKQIV